MPSFRSLVHKLIEKTNHLPLQRHYVSDQISYTKEDIGYQVMYLQNFRSLVNIFYEEPPMRHHNDIICRIKNYLSSCSLYRKQTIHLPIFRSLVSIFYEEPPMCHYNDTICQINTILMSSSLYCNKLYICQFSEI